jgi:hypothetical protein
MRIRDLGVLDWCKTSEVIISCQCLFRGNKKDYWKYVNVCEVLTVNQDYYEGIKIKSPGMKEK